MINTKEGQVVDGVNGVDLTLPRQDLGRMNTDLEDTVNNETYTCLGTCVKLKDKSHMKAPIMLYANICPSSQEGPGARGDSLFHPNPLRL